MRFSISAPQQCANMRSNPEVVFCWKRLELCHTIQAFVQWWTTELWDPPPQSCVLILTALLWGYKCLSRHAGKTRGIWTQLKQHLHQIHIFVSQSKVLVMFFSGTHFQQGRDYVSCGVALGHMFLLPLCVVLVYQNKQSCSNKNWPTLSPTQGLLSRFRTQCPTSFMTNFCLGFPTAWPPPKRKHRQWARRHWSVLAAIITRQLHGQNMALRSSLSSSWPRFDYAVGECVSH